MSVLIDETRVVTRKVGCGRPWFVGLNNRNAKKFILVIYLNVKNSNSFIQSNIKPDSTIINNM